MRAKDFMENVLDASQRLKLLNMRRAEYLSMATSMSIDLSGMPHGTDKNSRVEAGAIGMADTLALMDAECASYTKLIRRAEELIEKLPQYKFREVLTYKYIIGLETWAEIGEKMGFKGKKSAARVHGYALRELQKIMREP